MTLPGINHSELKDNEVQLNGYYILKYLAKSFFITHN